MSANTEGVSLGKQERVFWLTGKCYATVVRRGSESWSRREVVILPDSGRLPVTTSEIFITPERTGR
jgi:hypothetical protein